MVSKLFQQTVGGALVVGIVFALFDLEYFVPGCFFGAVAALLTFGIRDPQQSVLDLLNKETDTNIFKAFVADLLSRIEEVGVQRHQSISHESGCAMPALWQIETICTPVLTCTEAPGDGDERRYAPRPTFLSLLDCIPDEWWKPIVWQRWCRGCVAARRQGLQQTQGGTGRDRLCSA